MTPTLGFVACLGMFTGAEAGDQARGEKEGGGRGARWKLKGEKRKRGKETESQQSANKKVEQLINNE